MAQSQAFGLLNLDVQSNRCFVQMLNGISRLDSLRLYSCSGNQMHAKRCVFNLKYHISTAVLSITRRFLALYRLVDNGAGKILSKRLFQMFCT